MENSSNSSSMSSYNPQEDMEKFDVFLSFRGEDTGSNFAGHLYAVLEQKGIYTFKDDVVEHETGENISPELLKTIQESRCSIVILSKDYASSARCLSGLAKIVECMGTWGRILPIFYHVEPSHVRKQSGSYEEAFKRHEADPKHKQNVKSWRDALTTVGNLSGFHVEENKTDEAKFIQNFVVEISRKIGNPKIYTLEGISGVDSRLNKFELCVNQSFGKVRFIGICGMVGIGKTTLAKAYYNRISDEFEGCCSFLEDVREVCQQENGPVELQNILVSDILKGSATVVRNVQSGKTMIRKMLCNKKVLIVLDDVNELEQLKALAGKEDWFGSGSIIIVTTRDESLVKKAYGNKTPIYKVELLNESEALELFSWKAFKSTHPLENYSELCNQVLAYANGLPLALEVLGSVLEGLHVNEWESALSRLEEYPNMEILDVLQVSFDGLEEPEKDIFLDIACFFVGRDKDYVIETMNCCGRLTDIGIRVLIHKSLLIIDDDNKLWMHELLQEMGKQIVRKESAKGPGSRSRLWDANDFSHVLEEKTGTVGVEAIVTSMKESTRTFEALSKMKKLRLLIIFLSIPPINGNRLPDYCHLDYLSNELGILEWNYFPYKGFPSSFRPDKLVKLMLTESNIQQICWNNVPTQPALSKLKIINLSYSRALSKLEDFNVVPNLEQLILEGCTKLPEIHTSITTLKWLILLNLKNCISLENLPPRMNGLESLKILNLYGCSNLSKLPEDFELLKSLEDLDVRRSAIKHVPSFIAPIENLKATCSTLAEDMEDLYKIVGKDYFSGINLGSLTMLNLSGRNLSDETVPQCFNHFVSLESLDLSGNHFSVLPLSINQLPKLQLINLENCKRLIRLGPELPSNLEIISVNNCTSLISFLEPSKSSYFCCRMALCVNCFELVTWQDDLTTAFTSFKRYLQYSPPPTRDFEIVLPCRKMATWFSRASSEPSTSIYVGPNWCNSSFKGLALCAFFTADPSDNFYCDINFSNDDEWLIRKPCPATSGSCAHLWLLYVPRHNFPTEWLQQNRDGQFEISFYRLSHGYLRHGVRFGFRLVYQKDIEDLKQEAATNYYNEYDYMHHGE